ncbi:ArsR/SmtB family transcription factor [Brachybacterium alimentarium]|uniref:ArsR/SmtB family transcription factor n=1 Tax=Brachybacterium alimentarium TaxID=47845 RepID=UPI000DF1CF6E|nr:winged helix-turn-helix domain-containing protein [Brachybacterium alimentarium]RCS82664.1 ArsR family transcriptional regulator [Brachybacterium alimentarium]RCS88199.1 ArsR family transcriptional regulator [Brachybacterium alimentarium]
MDTIDEERADAWFHALSDRTRRDILRRVMRGEQSVSSLARNYSMSLTAVQKHVVTLERAGLITRRRSGRETLASGEAGAVRSAARLLAELEDVWRERIARIDDLLGAEAASLPAAPQHPPAAQHRAAASSPPRKD